MRLIDTLNWTIEDASVDRGNVNPNAKRVIEKCSALLDGFIESNGAIGYSTEVDDGNGKLGIIITMPGDSLNFRKSNTFFEILDYVSGLSISARPDEFDICFEYDFLWE